MSLHALMEKYGSDKASYGFCDFYESYFRPVREQVTSVLEIGVADGASIRAWLDYFPDARIFGFDAHESLVGRYGDKAKWPYETWEGVVRFKAFTGDQANRQHLARLLEWGPWDIVIDDGGHTMEQQQVSLAVLFPHTRMFYVVEDLHTSFVEEVTIYDPNGPARSYPTGRRRFYTTWDMLDDLVEYGGPGMHFGYTTDEEYDAIGAAQPEVHVFDRDGDHKHMTSVLEVK